MEYRLINEDFQTNYIQNLCRALGVEADILLDPPYTALQNPLALDNIETGATLLLQTLEKCGQIVFIVDSDTDGMTSSAILWLYIKQLYPDARLRFKIHTAKQHGLEDMIEELVLESGEIDLVICPDSSSNDDEQHFILNECGVPVLVLDHHLISVPNSMAIVINNQSSPNYTNKQLTGAGVVYQFCRYLDGRLGINYADKYLDLAALGIIADMGKVTEPENAWIIKKGLEMPVKNLLFQSFLDKQSYSIGDKMNSISIAFYVSPLINALIRVGTQDEKEKMFLAFIEGDKMVPSTKRGEKGKQELLATQVVRNCVNARVHQNKELDSALEKISFKVIDEGLDANQLLIIELDEEDTFNPTLNGLLAMKCCALYNKPTLVLRTNSEGIARGSLRGVNNSKLESLKGYLESTNLCEYCAGHDQAAGCGIKQSRIPELISRANQDLLQYNFGTTYYNVNFVRDASSKDIRNIIYDIDRYYPIYGQGCDEPRIAVKNISFTKKDMQIMGKNKDTVKIMYNNIAYMMFHAKDFIEEINDFPAKTIGLEIVGRGNVNEWAGTITPQIFIDDYNLCNYDLMF